MARLAMIFRSCARASHRSVACGGVASVVSAGVGQAQPKLVELRRHLFEALLPKVGDVEEIVRRPLHQFTDRLDLGTAKAVAGTLRGSSASIGARGPGTGELGLDLAQLQTLASPMSAKRPMSSRRVLPAEEMASPGSMAPFVSTSSTSRSKFVI